jgi:hypothetical protein
MYRYKPNLLFKPAAFLTVHKIVLQEYKDEIKGTSTHSLLTEYATLKQLYSGGLPDPNTRHTRVRCKFFLIVYFL